VSQAGIISTTGGPSPPQVPTSFTTDVRDNNSALSPGTAVPAANILQILGRDTNQNNDNGIRTDADPNNGNIIYVELTNRVSGQITTTDATPTSILSIPLGSVPGVYIIEGDLIGYDVTDAAGGAYTFIGAARTTGVVGIEIAAENKNVFEEVAMSAADFNFGVTGNTAFLEVIGLAGKQIDWSALFTYRFIG